MKRHSLLFICLVTFYFSFAKIYADDWTLASTAFTFSQKGEWSEAYKGAAKLIPQLILDQIAKGSQRLPTDSEMLDRTLDSLLTSRNSLFLQLQKEVKIRDSLVVNENSPRSLKKKIAEEDKKIIELQKQIDENLLKTEQAYKEYEERLNPLSKTEENKNFFKNMFAPKKENLIDEQTNEKIKLYKNDSTALFSVDEKYKDLDVKNREYEKSVNSAKINGLITGSITVYGDYCSVKAQLYIFPGAKVAGSISEVGSLEDCLVIARNIARYMQPVIANSLPVNLYFDIVPEEARKNASVTIDGSLYEEFSEGIIIQAGIHTVEVSSPGYNSQAVTYDFSTSNNFLMHSKLLEEKTGLLTVALKKPFEGTFFANGKEGQSTGPGKIDSELTINGESIIGYFLTNEHSVKKTRKVETDEKGNKKIVVTQEDGPLIGSFFYIPQENAYEGAQYIVNIDPVDNATNIDKRRIWMYRGYSALVCTLPMTFFCMGRYNSIATAYQTSSIDNYSQVTAWYTAQGVSLGITAVAGAFFVYEVVRYLLAADKVIPSQVTSYKSLDYEQSLAKSWQLERTKENQSDEIMQEQNADENIEDVKIDENKNNEVE